MQAGRGSVFSGLVAAPKPPPTSHESCSAQHASATWMIVPCFMARLREMVFFSSSLRRSILVKVAPPVFVPLRLSRPTFGPGFPTDTEGCCGAVVVLLLLLLACSRIIPCWHISFFPQPQSFPTLAHTATRHCYHPRTARAGVSAPCTFLSGCHHGASGATPSSLRKRKCGKTVELFSPLPPPPPLLSVFPLFVCRMKSTMSSFSALG